MQFTTSDLRKIEGSDELKRWFLNKRYLSSCFKGLLRPEELTAQNFAADNMQNLHLYKHLFSKRYKLLSRELRHRKPMCPMRRNLLPCSVAKLEDEITAYGVIESRADYAFS